MQNMLWSVDEKENNVHVLRATLAENEEIMDKKKRGI